MVKEASLILVMGGAEGLMEKAVISVEEGGGSVRGIRGMKTTEVLLCSPPLF